MRPMKVSGDVAVPVPRRRPTQDGETERRAGGAAEARHKPRGRPPDGQLAASSPKPRRPRPPANFPAGGSGEVAATAPTHSPPKAAERTWRRAGARSAIHGGWGRGARSALGRLKRERPAPAPGPQPTPPGRRPRARRRRRRAPGCRLGRRPFAASSDTLETEANDGRARQDGDVDPVQRLDQSTSSRWRLWRARRRSRRLSAGLTAACPLASSFGSSSSQRRLTLPAPRRRRHLDTF